VGASSPENIIGPCSKPHTPEYKQLLICPCSPSMNHFKSVRPMYIITRRVEMLGLLLSEQVYKQEVVQRNFWKHIVAQ
jgi:hypothetical protein